MRAPLVSSIVRIRTSEDRVVGAGLLVGDRKILTCAHVVARTLDLPDDTPCTPQSEVYLDFPLIAPQHIIKAQVILWQPPRPDGGGDIAGLVLGEYPPEGADPVQLVTADDLWGHHFRTYGFPAGHENGIWASGVIRGHQASGWLQIENLRGTGYRIEPGFSGAPVWDEELSGVAGMVVAAEGRTEVKAAFVVPTTVLIGSWPELVRILRPFQAVEPVIFTSTSPQLGISPFSVRQGRLILPDLLEEGLIQQLGRGRIQLAMPLDNKLLMIIADGGSELLDLRNRRTLWKIDCPCSSGTFSADGSLMALVYQSIIYVWDIHGGQFLQRFECQTGKVSAVVIRQDNQLMIGGSNSGLVELWDLQGERKIGQLEGHTAAINDLTVSPDGSLVAIGSSDRTVSLWDIDCRMLLWKLEGHNGAVRSVAFSPDGQLVVSGSYDNTVRIWNVESGHEVRRLIGHMNWVHDVAFGPRERLLASGSVDATIRLWNTQNGQELRRLRGHTSSVHSVVFSPDGRLLASISNDNTVRLWDVDAGRELERLEDQAWCVYSIAFSSNGRLLASGSDDGNVRLWDTESGQEILRLSGHIGQVKSVAFNPEGQRVTSGGADNIVRLWDVETGQEISQLVGHTSASWHK